MYDDEDAIELYIAQMKLQGITVTKEQAKTAIAIAVW